MSWLRCLAYVRNVCAHHGRLWNRELSLRPELLVEWGVPSGAAGRMYGVCLVLHHLLKFINPTFQWKEGLETLMIHYPGVSRAAMRFPDDWNTQSPWVAEAQPTKESVKENTRQFQLLQFPGREAWRVCCSHYRQSEVVKQTYTHADITNYRIKKLQVQLQVTTWKRICSIH